MNESELYNRVIKVDIAKPHRGMAGLDPTLPGMSPVTLFSILMIKSGNKKNGSRRMLQKIRMAKRLLTQCKD